jgi:hypothetical protein
MWMTIPIRCIYPLLCVQRATLRAFSRVARYACLLGRDFRRRILIADHHLDDGFAIGLRHASLPDRFTAPKNENAI